MHVINMGSSLSDEHKNLLSLQFTAKEIRDAIWSIPVDKSSGLDGFSSGFYKAAWPMVGDDVVNAVQSFF